MKVLILGASGLLGSACMRIMGQRSEIHVVGTYRTKFNDSSLNVSKIQHYQLSDILDASALEELFKNVSPDVVINGISLSKSDLEKSKPYLFFNRLAWSRFACSLRSGFFKKEKKSKCFCNN